MNHTTPHGDISDLDCELPGTAPCLTGTCAEKGSTPGKTCFQNHCQLAPQTPDTSLISPTRTADGERPFQNWKGVYGQRKAPSPPPRKKEWKVGLGLGAPRVWQPGDMRSQVPPALPLTSSALTVLVTPSPSPGKLALLLFISFPAPTNSGHQLAQTKEIAPSSVLPSEEPEPGLLPTRGFERWPKHTENGLLDPRAAPCRVTPLCPYRP